jgi:hypothetical protein
MTATTNVGKISRKRILLVDDEPFSARTLRILLMFEKETVAGLFANREANNEAEADSKVSSPTSGNSVRESA